MLGCSVNGDLNDSEFSKPLPWIGVYISAASLACSLAMATDVFSAFRRRKLWFPTKFFTLNATTLTLLGIATKLPVDLNTSMPRRQDQLTKLSGTTLICIVIANFMPSLATMTNSEIASNVVALGILVITVIVNVCIQMGTGVIYVLLPEHALIMFFMLLLLLNLCSSALIVTTTKQDLEEKCPPRIQTLAHALFDNDSAHQHETASVIKRAKDAVNKCLLVIHTCRPQFVLGRSATSTASGALCLLSALVLVEASARSLVNESVSFCGGTSDYRWSSTLVFFSQAIAVGVGTIAPAYRWFDVVSRRRWSCSGKEFMVERYWTLKLHEWKKSPLPRGWKNALQWKNRILDASTKLQTGVVLMSKSVRLVSVMVVSWLRLVCRPCTISSHCDCRATIDKCKQENVGLRDVVLHLEGEEESVESMVRTGLKCTEQWVEDHKKKIPTSLIELLMEHSPGFKGVGGFYSNKVPSLDEDDSRNGWALPVVTLATIAIALSYTEQSLIESLDPLLNGVSEGLVYVRIVEYYYKSISKAAEIVWEKINRKHNVEIKTPEIDSRARWYWFDEDLQEIAHQEKSGKNIIKRLRDIGKAKITYTLLHANELTEGDLDNSIWIANCMYRVTETILQGYDANFATERELFQWLRVTIADILGACFTNLTRAVCLKFYHGEMQEKNIKETALRIYAADDILKILGYPVVPDLSVIQQQNIDDWRKKMQNDPSCLPSTLIDNWGKKMQKDPSYVPSISTHDQSGSTSKDLSLTIV